MKLETFRSYSNKSISFFSKEWRNKYAELLNSEHWDIIITRIFSFVVKDEISHNLRPNFNEEIIADYPKHYQFFEKLKHLVEKDESEISPLIAQTIEETPIASLLIILGQRKTSATITDENGIPPRNEQVLKSCFAPHNKQKSKAARAREKHISRNNESGFWGKIEGNPRQKEEVAKTVVKKIINEKTWWNVFTHYKHDVVYEVRVATGEGMRWKKENLELIGFLEPFINDEAV